MTKAVWRGTNAIESWSWKGCEGNRAIVEVYADAYQVELLLDGKSIGKKKIKEYRAIFKTKYISGTLTAVSYNQAGQELARSSLIPADGNIKISVQPEKNSAKPGEVVYVDVLLTGDNGVVESNADTCLTVTVKGGELLAFGSANPCTEESYNAGSFSTYYGRALAVVRMGDSGDVSIQVKGEGCAPAEGHIRVV